MIPLSRSAILPVTLLLLVSQNEGCEDDQRINHLNQELSFLRDSTDELRTTTQEISDSLGKLRAAIERIEQQIKTKPDHLQLHQELQSSLQQCRQNLSKLQAAATKTRNILEVLAESPQKARQMLINAGGTQPVFSPAREKVKSYMQTGLFAIFHFFVGIVYIAIVGWLIRVALEADRLARWVALGTGFAVYFISAQTGTSLAEFMALAATSEMHMPTFWIIGTIMPGAAGSVLSYLILRKLGNEEGQRWVLLFGAFLSALMADAFAESVTSNLLPNALFVIGFVLVYLLKSKVVPKKDEQKQVDSTGSPGQTESKAREKQPDSPKEEPEPYQEKRPWWKFWK